MATNNAVNQIGVLPSFMSVNNADQAAVTGDGTDYTVTFVNELYDTTSSFDGASTFTAPLTGKYAFSCGLYLNNLAVGMLAGTISIVTTSATYDLLKGTIYSMAVGGDFIASYSLICPMTVGDTARIHVQVNNGAKQVNIIGATNSGFRSVYFSGYMISGI